jgi:hypothetical protein
MPMALSRRRLDSPEQSAGLCLFNNLKEIENGEEKSEKRRKEKEEEEIIKKKEAS